MSAGASSGPGSHAPHEAPSGLRPSGFDPSRGFAIDWWEFLRQKGQWENCFCDLLADDEEYERIGTDDYDGSLEVHGASNDWRLSENQQRFLFGSGFLKIYVRHLDGWETHYTQVGDSFPVRGWRRRYVSEPGATTTRVISGPTDNGYYEISYWPEGWNGPGQAAWLKTGYMRIVPDPLDPFSDSDGSPEGEKPQALSAQHDSAGPKGIAQTPASRNPNP